MKLCDRMVYAGIVNSRRVAALSWFHRDVFRNLLHVADGYGRFEADAGMLRAVLYAPMLSKVSDRDVQGALVACHQAGLVKLYTVEDRGYGKVLNFRQSLSKRVALYPPEPGEQEPELFGGIGSGEPSAAPGTSERKKEGNSPHNPPPAGGSPSHDLGGQAAPNRAATRNRSPERQRKSATDELDAIERELTEILYPGGCAFKVTPTGDKLDRYTSLMKRRAALKARLEKLHANLGTE